MSSKASVSSARSGSSRQSRRSRGRKYSLSTPRRTTPACLNCVKDKARCTGGPPHPCVRCGDRKICVYPPPGQGRKYVDIGEWESIQARLAAFEPGPPSNLDLELSDDDNNDDDDHAHENDSGEENLTNFEDEALIYSRSGTHFLIGSASSTWLLTKLDDSNRAAAVDLKPHYNDRFWPKSRPSPIPIQLPENPNLAMKWYRKQHIYIGTIFSFSQPRDFKIRLARVYKDPFPDVSSMEDRLVYCQVLLLLGFGSLYDVNQFSHGDNGPPGFLYFKDALHYLPDIHEEASILFVEVLGVVGYYFMQLNLRDAAFNYIGIALRMAISLGLHREVASQAIAPDDREHRRRVWWSVYSMDRILSVKCGNPTAIHDEDIDVDPPSYQADLDTENSLAAQTLLHYTELSKILGRIGQGIYRRHNGTGTNLLRSVQSILTSLAKWHGSLPANLRLDFDALNDLNAPFSREAVSTYLHYYHCVNMTARPLIFFVAQRRLRTRQSDTNWTSSYSPSVVAIVKKTIAAAREITLIAKAAMRRDLLATFGFMDCEHASTSAILLVLAFLAFPANERDRQAMELAMSVLKEMADKGNQFIAARHGVLENLIASRKQDGEVAANKDSTPGGSEQDVGDLVLPVIGQEVEQQPVLQMPEMQMAAEAEVDVEVQQQYLPLFEMQDTDAITFNLEDEMFYNEMTREMNIDVNMDRGFLENRFW